MLREFIEYIVGLKRIPAPTATIDGKEYVLCEDGTINMPMESLVERCRRRDELDSLPVPSMLKTTTLSSIINYIVDDPEGFFAGRGLKPVIHIENPTQATLYAQLDQFTRRIPIIRAQATTPNLTLDRPLDIERFIINLQSCFAETDDRDLLLSIVSKITKEASEKIEDNGVSQTVTVRKGVVNVGPEKMPNPVRLAPFRTFIEVEQPQSLYVFRVHEGPTVALYTAGGAEWEIAAMDAIKDFFVQELDGKDVHIIA